MNYKLIEIQTTDEREMDIYNHTECVFKEAYLQDENGECHKISFDTFMTCKITDKYSLVENTSVNICNRKTINEYGHYLNKEIPGLDGQIRKIIAEKFVYDFPNLTNNTKLIDDLDMDSLDIIEMITELETIFQVRITDEDAERFETIGDIISEIKLLKK